MTFINKFTNTGNSLVHFSQEEYMVNESAGYITLKVIISGRIYLPISFNYKVFVSNTEFKPNPGLYSVYSKFK